VAVVLTTNSVSFDDSLVGQSEHFKVNLISVPSSFEKVRNLSGFHQSAPVLMSGKTRFIVIRMGLQKTEGGQIAISQTASNLNLVPDHFKEFKLMSVLITLARWIGVIKYSIKICVFQLGHCLFPRSEHRVSSRVGLLPFKCSVVNVFVNF
jgi:hypothetical protein